MSSFSYIILSEINNFNKFYYRNDVKLMNLM